MRKVLLSGALALIGLAAPAASVLAPAAAAVGGCAARRLQPTRRHPPAPRHRGSTTCRSSARSRSPASGVAARQRPAAGHRGAVVQLGGLRRHQRHLQLGGVVVDRADGELREQQQRVGRPPRAERARRAARRPGAASAFWVGLDGYTSTSVEQLGTDSDCDSGTPSLLRLVRDVPQPLGDAAQPVPSEAGRPDDGSGVGELDGHVVHADDEGRDGRLDVLDHADRERLRPVLGRGDRRGAVLVQRPVLQRGAAGRLRPGRLLGLGGDRRRRDQGIAVGLHADEITMADNGTTLATPSSLSSDGSSFSVTWNNS